MIVFDKLQALAKAQGKSIYHLKRDKIIGTSALDSMRRGDKSVTTETINRVCAYFNCQPADIMEYVPDTRVNHTENGKE